MGVEPPNGSPSIHLVTSLSAETLAANSHARLRLILATLEQCRASLVNEAEHDTADLLSVTILQLRMKPAKGVTDPELKPLCDAGGGSADTAGAPSQGAASAAVAAAGLSSSW